MRTTHLAALCALCLPAARPPAQTFCDGRGSEPRAGRIETGPPLGCAFAPLAPGFQLLEPPFRAIVPRAGWRLVRADARPRLIVRYRCTGFWLLPVVPADVAVYGVVLDVESEPCPSTLPHGTGG